MSNSKNIQSNTIVRSIIAVALTAIVATAAFAGERNPHNPYTFLGVQLRSQLAPTTPGANGESLGPLVFQEIVPCRFVSTLEADHYDDPWGGKAFLKNESRTYFPKGYLVSAKGWENPCSLHIPSDAVAVSLRLMAHTPDNAGTVYLAPSMYNAAGQSILQFAARADEMEEASVVMRNDGFAISTNEAADLTIDITGYFLRDDPNAYGQKGEKGDRGEQGLQGERGADGAQGLQGIQGERGLQGIQGERGLQGERGADGAQGIQGERGEQGLQGIQGVQGERGLQGERGEQGLQGIPGEKGADGAQGPQGIQGEKGADGAQGPQGIQGDKGADGAIGPQGLQGIQGIQGEKGEKGDMGPMGPMGPKGDKGNTGDKGDKGDKGDPGTGVNMSQGWSSFPPPGSIMISDSNVTLNSFIIVQYDEVSNGNAIAVASQGNGWFVASGSPNKAFKYLVLTPQ